MATRVQPYRIAFPEGYDAQAEFEAPFRGYLPDVAVLSEDGSRHRLAFIDPARLEQNLADHVRMGRPYYAEPGLVILPEVSTEAIREAVQGLWDEGFFGKVPPGGGLPQV
ncbi:MAG TPA: hypothetical protein VF590_27980 [Isosphaeraceae bacterium]|jgi:hypothetical protein